MRFFMFLPSACVAFVVFCVIPSTFCFSLGGSVGSGVYWRLVIFLNALLCNEIYLCKSNKPVSHQTHSRVHSLIFNRYRTGPGNLFCIGISRSTVYTALPGVVGYPTHSFPLYSNFGIAGDG